MSILDIFSDLNNHKDIHNCLCLFTNFVHNGTKIFGKECGKDCLKIITELKKFCIDNNGVIWFYVFNSDDEEYVKNIVLKLYDIYLKHSNNRKFISRGHNNIKLFKYTNKWDIDGIFLNIKKNMQIKYMPKFDYIIQNPPYTIKEDKQYHLQFLEKGLDLLTDNGKMVIIEPSTWLIDIKPSTMKNNVGKRFNPIKKLVKGQISKIIIENYNSIFNTELYMPFSITYINKNKKFDKIDFICCGEHYEVESIDDCNLIGNYNIWNSILSKVLQYGDFMKNHIYKSTIIKDNYYCKYPEIFGGCGASFCGTVSPRNGADYNSDNIYITINNGMQYITPYISAAYHYNLNFISDKILCKCNKANKLTDTPAECLTDTKEHLENWKYFIFNNKLPIFLNICLTIDQHNNSKNFLPWIVDKKYTDEEIYKLLGITEEEQIFINKTLKKFERNSPWFKRYLIGDTTISEEEIKKYLESI